jgi:NAD(P)-dependent dehydrogenase (short-subunit alcohol dehydrogenase family)
MTVTQPPSMRRLNGKVALVTGGAGRIGAATARRLASEGARVSIGDISEEGAAAIARSIGDQALAVQFDAGDPDSIARMVARTVERFGRLDILHNNAALLDLAFLDQDRDAVQTSIEVWDTTMQVNVRGYMLACKHAIPHMLAAGGGSIINTASNAALLGDSSRIAYGSSKGAIISMTRYIATQHGRSKIRCNAISPGLILDDELERKLPEMCAATARHVLLPRHGRPEDIAAMVAFFASDDSSFVTGQLIACDGGMLAHQPFIADMADS